MFLKVLFVLLVFVCVLGKVILGGGVGIVILLGVGIFFIFFFVFGVFVVVL